MDDIAELFQRVARLAADYRDSLAGAVVAPRVDHGLLRAGLGDTLPEDPLPPATVIDELTDAVGPGLVHTAGPRFFGFVIGGSLASAAAADMLTTGWDQCAFNAVLSPASAIAEEVAGTWLKDVLGLPASASVGFVTGGQAANTVGLAAGRHQVLIDAGWDVEADGLAAAPRVRIVASAERHATIDRALRLLGFGTRVIEEVAADANGAIDVDDLERTLASRPVAPTIVSLQAGNVNTGACDDFHRAIGVAKEREAWVHVDGAFGLWAAASSDRRELVDGVGLADSWACDGHKWLNVPYDSGFAFCARPEAHRKAVSYTAPYLVGSGGARAGPSDYTLESSRRARGFATWAALRELGRNGIAELVERNCSQARRFADRLQAGGAEIGNDVVLNQVLVRFGDDDRTDRVIDAVQRDGTCWMGGTTWRGRRYMRVAVSNWSTSDADVDLSVEAILRIVRDLAPDGAVDSR
jgi:glutamate/tyrosine decarboxylase-like PLP-dependent enzyme